MCMYVYIYTYIYMYKLVILSGSVATFRRPCDSPEGALPGQERSKRGRYGGGETVATVALVVKNHRDGLGCS